MARRGGQVPAPAVDPPELDLDAREPVGAGEGRGRLQGPDRGWILAEPRTQLADPDVDGHRFRATEGEGRLEMFDRFAVGEDSLCAVGRLEVGRCSFRRAPGGPLVAGDPGDGRHVVAAARVEVQAKRVGGAPVEESATGEAGHLVRLVAQATMAEVVADRSGRATRATLDLADDPASHQLLDGIDRLLLRAAARPADGREVERPADDRGCRQHLRRRLADRCDPLPKQGTELARDAPRCLVPGSERLDDLERQALGVGDDGIDEGLTRRRCGPGGGLSRMDEACDRGPVEPFEDEDEDAWHPDQVTRRRQPIGRQILSSPGHQQDHGRPWSRRAR